MRVWERHFWAAALGLKTSSVHLQTQNKYKMLKGHHVSAGLFCWKIENYLNFGVLTVI